MRGSGPALVDVELRISRRDAEDAWKPLIDRMRAPILRALRDAEWKIEKVDEILLVSDTEPDQILALSFWQSQQDAERYTHEQYPRINELISHLVESPPVSRTFNVDIFTSHKITRGKAA